MLSSEDRALIEQYLQKNLNGDALAAFLARMEMEEEFFEEVLSQQAIQEAALGVHYKKMAQSLQDNETEEWEDFRDILNQASKNQLRENEQESRSKEKTSSTPTYSLEELLEEFRVVSAYERMMETVERGGNLVILQPSNRIICHNRKLSFLLRKRTTDDMLIRIENNQRRMVLTHPIASNLTEFTIDLPKELFPKGLYYWKLMNSEEMVMGSFILLQSAHTPPKT